MANPNFGKWPSEDDVDEIDIFGTAPSAEEEALEHIEEPAPKRSYGWVRPRPEKITVQAKKIFVRPETADAVSSYRSPFTENQAAEILKNVEIVISGARALARIVSTYVASGYDGKSQAIIVDAAGREVHLLLRRVAGLRWRVVKAVAADNFAGK